MFTEPLNFSETNCVKNPGFSRKGDDMPSIIWNTNSRHCNEKKHVSVGTHMRVHLIVPGQMGEVFPEEALTLVPC